MELEQNKITFSFQITFSEEHVFGLWPKKISLIIMTSNLKIIYLKIIEQYKFKVLFVINH